MAQPRPSLGLLLILFVFSEELCKHQMLLLVKDVGDWVKFPETTHELYAHLAEMIGKLESFHLENSIFGGFIYL